MKGLYSLLTKQHTQQPTTTANSPVHSKFRTGKNLSGAFLLLAVITAGIYGAAPNNGGAKQVTANSSPAATPAQLQTKQDTTTMQQPSAEPTPPATNPQSSGTSTSTSVNTVNGQTEVRVNGHVVTPDTNGNVSKTLNTDNGTVHISVDQSGGSSSSSVDYNSSSSSNDSNTSWNDSMNNSQ